MAIVNEIENGLIGQAGYDAAQLVAPADFTVTAPGGPDADFPMSPTATVEASMAGLGDQDYFRVTLAAQSWVRLDIDGATPDLTMFVYRPNGTLALTIPGFAEGDPGSVGTQDPFVEFMVGFIEGGEWRIGLQVGGGAAIGAYRLHISQLSAAFAWSGGAGADVAEGEVGADTLFGYAPGTELTETGADTLDGGGGNDLLRGGGGADSLLGGGNDDRLVGAAGNDTLIGDLASGAGPGGQDTLSGGGGNDVLRGGVDRDVLLGGFGADVLEGGAGNDRLLGDGGDDTLHDGTALDSPDGFADILDGGAGNDRVLGGWGDRLLGGAGDDDLIVTIRSVNALLGASFVDGGTGTDTLILGGSGELVSLDLVAGTGGSGAISVIAQPAGGATIAGTIRFLGIEALQVTAESGTDTLLGGSGNDVLSGGGGPRDVIGGGEGDDVLWSYRPVTTFIGDAIDSTDVLMQGGAGNDGLVLQGAASSGLLDGGDGADTLYATDGGDAVLLGGDGADTVRVSRGRHYADGGDGDDVLVLDTPVGLATPLWLESFGDGSGAASWGGQSLDFVGFERLFAFGAELADTIQGGGGADTLYGYAGADSLAGGAGNDLYFVDQAGDMILDPSGRDRVIAEISWSLGSGLEELQLEGAAALTGTGNGADNLMFGSSAANTLYGVSGADTLNGRGGADRLFGGSGNDVFVLRLDEAQGDRLMDFAGNGAAAGDVIRFEGYGAGATVTLYASAVGGTTWRVQGALGFDTFVVAGGNPALFDPAFDAVFA